MGAGKVNGRDDMPAIPAMVRVVSIRVGASSGDPAVAVLVLLTRSAGAHRIAGRTGVDLVSRSDVAGATRRTMPVRQRLAVRGPPTAASAGS